jgi:hypothetical protein
MKKTNDAGTSLVPDYSKPRQSGSFVVLYRTKIIYWNADGGVSFLDADAQLWE